VTVRPRSSLPLATLGPLLALLAASCEREPLDCTRLAPGDLALSEIRGEQSAEDSGGQWIELYNTTDAAIELSGVTLRLLKLDGSGEAEIRIRDLGLKVGPGEYAVLGRFDAASAPSHIDYAFADDFDSDLYPDAVIEVIACAAVVDRVVYHNLPQAGTLAFDGGRALTAEANDDEAAWCTDDRLQGTSYWGTPGESNATCD